MNVAVHPQPSTLTAFFHLRCRQMHALICQPPSYLFSITSVLFIKSSYIAHCKALSESIIYFAISKLRTLVPFPVFLFLLSCLFSSKCELFAKKQGGGVGGYPGHEPIS